MLRSDLWDYSDTYIAVKGRVTVIDTNNAFTRNQKLNFKNSGPFRLCISKINNIFIDNADGLNIITHMYNLLEYTDNYSMISKCLWNYHRNDVNDDPNGNNVANNYSINKTITSKSFEFKGTLMQIWKSPYMFVFI